MRIRRLAVLVASMMLASLTAGAATAQDGSVLRVARLADHYNDFHPAWFGTGNQFQWFNTVFNTLINVEADSATVVPSLADSWEVSDDATEFTFNLNPDATWHDGEPFTADDVIFTIDFYNQNPDSYVNAFLPQWGQIAGAADVKGTTDHTAGVEKIDDHTVKITLAAPNAEFLVRLADMAHMITPEHILAPATAALADRSADSLRTLEFSKGVAGVTVGTGPYKIVSVVPDTSVEVEANADYFKGAPLIDRIVFKMFADPALAIAQAESGDLDLIFRAPPAEFDRLDGIDGMSAIAADNPGVFRIVVATEKAPFSAKEVRQAIAYSLNKQAIVDQFYKGRAKVLYGHPGFKVYDDINKYDHDPAKAQELLAGAGYAGEPFRILYDSTFPDAGTLMPLIQADLIAGGINAELFPTEGADAFTAALEDRTSWEGFIAIGGSEGLSPDRSQQYYNATNANFQSGYMNPRIFELWAAGRASGDPAVRDEAYHELALILNEDLPQIHTHAPSLVMAASDSLGGGFDIHLNERETFMDVETWTLE
jgi:peptide/nickel transport system substrate-binding protein